MRRASVAARVSQLLAWSVIVAAVAALLAAVVVPRLAGATPYTVLTSSMEPELPPGTLVVVRPTDTERIGVGTVITYQLHSGRDTVVTHRVVAQGHDGRGVSYQTRGDANEDPDPEWVRPVQVRGELWYSVPLLGHVNDLVTGTERRMIVHGVVAVLLGYAAFMLTSAARDRLRPEPRGESV